MHASYFGMQGYSPTASMLIAGVTGGVFAAACSHPFDTAKTRMQVGCAQTRVPHATWQTCASCRARPPFPHPDDLEFQAGTLAASQ